MIPGRPTMILGRSCHKTQVAAVVVGSPCQNNKTVLIVPDRCRVAVTKAVLMSQAQSRHPALLIIVSLESPHKLHLQLQFVGVEA